MLCRDSLGPVMIGLACGVFLSLASGRVVQSLLYGVSARDPLALIAAITMLLAAATIAVFFPVRRAASLHLAQLLKLG